MPNGDFLVDQPGQSL